MLKLYDFDDYDNLPLTKWNIKQPNADDAHRENPMLTGDENVDEFISVCLILTTRFSSLF